jgi:hypothetical protein
MYGLSSERDPATKNDLRKGKNAEKGLYEIYKSINTNGYEPIWMNEEYDTFNLFDIVLFNKKLDKAKLQEIEGKNRQAFNTLLKNHNNPSGSEYKNIHFANKKFYDLYSDKIIKSGISIIGRPFTKEELDDAVTIMLPLDGNIDFGLKVNIKKSIFAFYDFDRKIKLENGKDMPFNSRRTMKPMKREDCDRKPGYVLNVPYEEAILNDYRF